MQSWKLKNLKHSGFPVPLSPPLKARESLPIFFRFFLNFQLCTEQFFVHTVSEGQFFAFNPIRIQNSEGILRPKTVYFCPRSKLFFVYNSQLNQKYFNAKLKIKKSKIFWLPLSHLLDLYLGAPARIFSIFLNLQLCIERFLSVVWEGQFLPDPVWCI